MTKAMPTATRAETMDTAKLLPRAVVNPLPEKTSR